MLRKILKWTGVTVATLLLLCMFTYGYIHNNISTRLQKRYNFLPEYVDIPVDSEILARGAHLVAIKGCNDCHAKNLAGKVMVDDAMIGRITATNLTKGPGGLPESYQTTDWVRALRHGIGQDGRPLIFMPSHETTLLSEPDLAAIIAYCQALPPVAGHAAPQRIGPVARVLTYFGQMPLLSAEQIVHEQPLLKATDTSSAVAVGKYLSISCSGCHKPDMKGGPPAAPGFPPVPDITAAGHPGRWSETQFIAVLRTGKTPAGHQMNPDEMPWKMTAQYDDKELSALYQYLTSLK